MIQIALGGALLALIANGVPLIGAGPERERAAPTATATRAAKAPKRFNARRAMALVRRQVAYGQRAAGSPALRRLAVKLRTLLPRGAFEALPDHPGLRNVVGTIAGRRPAIVVGAHYDTEARPEGFVGANDGAAGTAAVVEIARALRRERAPAGAREIRFVLFDGEEEPPGSTDFLLEALRGSKAYVATHRGQVASMVLLDYVANRGLRLPREGSSDRALWTRLRAAARRTGNIAVFPPGAGVALYDDHTPFLRAGIPAIDLIDFSYPHRDTLADTVDKLSVNALDAVGETVVELLVELRAR